jgi:hypothetical protein
MQEEEKSVEPSPLPEVESKNKSKIKKTIIRDENENGNHLTKSGAIDERKGTRIIWWNRVCIIEEKKKKEGGGAVKSQPLVEVTDDESVEVKPV